MVFEDCTVLVVRIALFLQLPNYENNDQTMSFRDASGLL